MPDMTKIFASLGENGSVYISDEVMRQIERFTIVMYSRTSPHTDLAVARQSMFADGRSLECLPPTKEALKQHSLRAILQTVIDKSAAHPFIDRPPPERCGWKKNAAGYWTPYWSEKPPVCKSLQQFIKCRCKKRCAGNCTCLSYPLPCTPLCACWSSGGCSRLTN